MKAKNIFNRFTEILPPKRQVRFNQFWHLHFEASEIELKNLAKLLPDSKRRALDIGANRGYYSVEFCKYFEQIEAFEINSGLTKNLSKYDPKIAVHDIGLSSRCGDATLYIPTLGKKKIPLVGWASLSPNNCPDTKTHIEKPVAITTLDHFEFRNIDFIKLDVEGHELHVLEGGLETIRKCLPRILLEARNETLEIVRQFLSKIGYIEKTRQMGFALSSGNYFFVPSETDNTV